MGWKINARARRRLDGLEKVALDSFTAVVGQHEVLLLGALTRKVFRDDVYADPIRFTKHTTQFLDDSSIKILAYIGALNQILDVCFVHLCNFPCISHA